MKEQNSPKHILVISQYFYPEQFRINDICCEWVKRGYKVTVLTGIPNYPQGKFYQGYGLKKKRKEKWKGIDIIRIPLIPRGHNSMGLILNYLSFPISGWFWNLISNINADYVFMFETSPMTQCKIGCWYAKKHKVPLYLYVQDLWPENVEIITGIHTPLLIAPIQRMVDRIYRNCTEIFVTSPSFKKVVCARNIPTDKVHYWPQYAEEFYVPYNKAEVKEIPADKSFKIIFTGNIGYAQGLQIIPKTAVLLKQDDVKFVMVGEGRYLEELKKEIVKNKVEDKFILISRRPAEQIPKLLAACDVAFLSFQDHELWTMTIPAKLQSYLACGMPVVASAAGETKRIIEEAECGICSELGNAEALAEAIKKIIQMDMAKMKKNSRKYFEQYFSKQKLMDKMDKYFEWGNE